MYMVGVDVGVYRVLYLRICGMNRYSAFKFIVWNILVTQLFPSDSRYKTKLFPVMCEEGLTTGETGWELEITVIGNVAPCCLVFVRCVSTFQRNLHLPSSGYTIE